MGMEGNPIEGNGSAKQEVEGESRVWTMQDLYKHPSARGYSRDLYNFAWARAVRKKPPDEAVLSNVVAVDESLKVSAGALKLVEEIKESSEGLVTGDGDGIWVEKAESEEGGSEKEEGELEEGEMDMDMNAQSHESDKEVKEEDVSNDAVDGETELDCGQIDPLDFDDRMLAILDTLESVTVAEVEKSFEGVCSELLNTLKSMRELVLVLAVPAMDTLVQLFLTAVTTVDSVYCSMNQDRKEQHKEIFIRLLSKIRSQRPIFSPAQIKDIQDMMSRTDGSDSSEISKANMYDLKVALKQNTDATQCPKTPFSDSLTNGYTSSNVLMALPETLKISTYRSKGMAPLLDLHKDHDLDSLPSPTGKSAQEFSKNITLPAGNLVSHQETGSNRTSFGTPRAVTYSFRTEALNAFSSYQQTFGGYERLPSPTPSEDNDNKDNDCHGEVSSSFSPPNHVNPSLLPSASTIPSANIGATQIPITVVTPSVVTSGINKTINIPARTRDPRLRYAGLDVGSLDLEQQRLVVENNASGTDPTGGPTVLQFKGNIRVEGSNLDDKAPKRQRNELSKFNIQREKNSSAGTCCWLDDNGTSRTNFISKNQTASTGNRLRDPRIGVAGYSNGAVRPDNKAAPPINNFPAFLPTGLLENIVVNPTILFEFLKNGSQQNLVREPLQKCNDPRTQIKNSGVPGTVGRSVATSNVSPLLPAAMMSAPGDKGVIRMKPRDPRRVLLSGKLPPEALPVRCSAESKRNADIQDPESQGNVKLVFSQAATAADSATRNTESPTNGTCSRLDAKPLTTSQILSASTMDERKTDACSMSEDAVGGLSKSPTTWGDVAHLYDGYDDQQRVAIQKERARRLDEQKKMFAERKLCLVLDLDHTLLNSAKFGEIDPGHEELLRKKEEQDREKPYRHLFRFPHMAMWTKLRPGIWNFLEKASKLFELHLYTMGNKSYAYEMAKILDPKGVLFAGRVISKGDDGDIVDGDDRVSKTKDLEGVLGMESSVVIIDDSIRVWPHNKLNLIVVERYIYFPCSRRQFGLPGPSLLEIDHDERPEDGTLASSLAVIERLHKNFFSHRDLDDVDVRTILAAEQRKILRGCRIVFSRVFPVGEASPHFHPLWQTAEQFGASCTNQTDDKVTHVVANSLGTDKVNWALTTGRYVVHPNWVEASALLYRRANEQDFAIKP